VPDVKFVLELFPRLGVTDFTSHIAAIQQSKADLLMCSFWSGDATIIMKQAAAVGLFKTMKGVFTTAGGVHDSLKKDFHAEGLLLGYNTMYFDDPKGSPLLKQFVREYKAKYAEYPPYECDHAYFCAESYKAPSRRPRRGHHVAERAAVVRALEASRSSRSRAAELAAGPRPDVQLLTRGYDAQELLRLRHDRPGGGRLDEGGDEAGGHEAASTGSTPGRSSAVRGAGGRSVPGRGRPPRPR